jgi:hypothetical protein
VKGSHIDWPHHQFFGGNIGHFLIEASILDPTLVENNKQMCFQSASLFSLYTQELNFGRTLWDNNLGAIGNILENNLRTWGISWEHDENTLRTMNKNKKPLTSPPIGKNWIHHECTLDPFIGCMKLLF